MSLAPAARVIELEASVQMLTEGAQDAIEAFKLLRLGMGHEPKAIEMIDAHVSMLEYAIGRTA